MKIELLSKVSVINQWAWNFGDGSTSSEKNPVHVYNDPGQYTVSLTVTAHPKKNRYDNKTEFDSCSNRRNNRRRNFIWDFGVGNR